MSESTRLALQAIQDEVTKPLHDEIVRLRAEVEKLQAAWGEIKRLQDDRQALLDGQRARCADIERLRADRLERMVGWVASGFYANPVTENDSRLRGWIMEEARALIAELDKKAEQTRRGGSDGHC